MLSDSLRDARTRAGISRQLLAELSKVPKERIAAWEEGGDEPSPEETDSVARAFGVRISDLRGADGWPLEKLLFRARGEQGLADLAETGSWQVIGEFLRAVADFADLERIEGRVPTNELPRLSSSNRRGSPWEVAETLANETRRALGIGAMDPIASMRDLVESLGVRVFFTTPSVLDPSVEGASTRVPRPAILVNLLEGRNCWWRTRTVLAHELCHLLIDHEEPEAFVSTPRLGATTPELFEGYKDVEQRANAFAACLLAPSGALRSLSKGLDPTSEEAITKIAAHFGIGRTTAINRIRDVFSLSTTTRESMRSRAAQTWKTEKHPDVAPCDGIRDGALQHATLDALRRGVIDRLRAREYLALPLTERLPAFPGIEESLLAPLRPPGDRARQVAQRYLVEQERRADLVAGEAERADYGWRVPIEGENRDIQVSFDMRVETTVT